MDKTKVSVSSLQAKKRNGQKITMLTAYDYPFAKIIDQAGIDIVFISDVMGMTGLGYRNTLSVTMEDMIHHTKAVANGVKRAFLLACMPFMEYNTEEDARRNARWFIKEGGADGVEIEGEVNGNVVKILALARDLSHAKGMSLLFSSHLLPDVEAVCDDVVVLGRGRLLAQGRIDDLKQPHDRQFEVRVKGDPVSFTEKLAERGIEAIPADDHLLVQLPPGTSGGILWETADGAGEQLRLRPRRSTLEEVFLNAVAEQN